MTPKRRKYPDDARLVKINLQATAEERAALKALAKERGLTLTELVKTLLTPGPRAQARQLLIRQLDRVDWQSLDDATLVQVADALGIAQPLGER